MLVPRPLGSSRARPVHAAALVGAATVTALVPALHAAPANAKHEKVGKHARTFQGESMSLHAGLGKTVRDRAASDGKALLIWSSAAAKRTRQLAAGRLVVRARGERCLGAPRMTVDVDGKRVLSTAVSSRTYRNYVSSSSVAAGSHKVRVSFTNDLSKRGCDRNLFLDRIATARTVGDAFKPSSPTRQRPGTPAKPDGANENPGGNPTQNPTTPKLTSTSTKPRPTTTPAPPAPTPTPAPSIGKVLFNGDFSLGMKPWSPIIHGERVAILDDPILGARRKVAKLTVYDGDIGPTENPRAQLEGPANLVNGGEYWVGSSTLFPSDFPVLPSGGWLSFMGIYGPPYNGAGPMALRVAGNTLTFQRNGNYDYDTPLAVPIQRGRWTDLVIHVKLSTDPSIGFVEVYMNTGGGWVQQSLKAQKRLYMKTLDSSNSGGANSFRVGNYRMRGMFSSVTLYHASPKVGTSFDAVAPNSY